MSSFARTNAQCDGHRPSCARCAKKSATCRYDVEPDISRLTSIRKRTEALQAELDLSKKLINHMHTCSDTEAQEIIRRLRTSGIAKSLGR